jgi:O-antigen/teichoic acid export membrane protein
MTNDVARGVARNTWILLFQYALTWGTNILAMMFLPRYLGPVSYGHFYVATTIINMFRVVVEYGGNYTVTKDTSRDLDRSGAIVADAVALRTLLGFLAFLAVIVIVLAASYENEVEVGLVIIGLSLLLHGAITVLTALFQGHEKMQFSSLATFVNRVITNLGVIPAVIILPTVWLVSTIGTIAAAVQFGVLVGFARRLVASFPRPSWKNIVREAKTGATYFLFVMFSSVYFRIDTVMLSKMAPDSVVGWYGAAYRVFDMMNFFPYLFTIAVYPVLSRLWKEDADQHRRAAQRSLEFMIILSIPVAVGLVFAARPLVAFFFGLESYAPTIVNLQILAVGLIFLFIDMVVGTTLMASDRQRQQAILALCAIPFNIGLNLFLIPYAQQRWGNAGIGSAVATVATEATIMVFWLSLLPRGTMKGFRVAVILKGFAAGGAMSAVIAGMTMLGIPEWIAVPAGLVVFLAGLFLMKLFDPDEEAFFRSILSIRGLGKAIQSLRGNDSTHSGEPRV